MRVQLWSYNYDPEPTGIGPVSTTLARRLQERGHEVVVVAAHPHYPAPLWGSRKRPYRELRDGISVLRLPLWIGRDTAGERYRQEVSFMLAQSAAACLLPAADVMISASPSFPALLPAIAYKGLRRIPWVLWLHDILPDGATATGLVEEGAVLSAARWLERTAYANADKIVVLSSAFTTNLVGKGVPSDRIQLIYDPATRVPRRPVRADERTGMRILSMGNIGFSQGLAPLVEAFERDERMKSIGARLVITGNGMAADDVRAAVRSDRVEMLGVVDDDRLELELQQASIAFVSQHYEGSEFNIPSKLMNFMAYGLPVLAAVNPTGEVAKIVQDAGAGWVVDSSRPEQFPEQLCRLDSQSDDVRRCSTAAHDYAARHFKQEAFAESFEQLFGELVA